VPVERGHLGAPVPGAVEILFVVDQWQGNPTFTEQAVGVPNNVHERAFRRLVNLGTALPLSRGQPEAEIEIEWEADLLTDELA
jgi:hypothetical protein